MERFLDAGVSLFVDLAEENEYPLPCAPTLTAAATERNTAVEHLRLPILNSTHQSSETDAQRQMILNWQESPVDT
jgi:hypothetical protein